MSVVPKRWAEDDVWVRQAPMSEASTVTTGKRADRVLYGVDGGELIRVQDRPLLGFHRENGRAT